MKTITLTFQLAICVCCLTALATCRADVFDVYIAAGQSNMDGRGHGTDLVGPLASFATPQSDVLLYYLNPNTDAENNPVPPTPPRSYESGGWVPLAPGYSVPPGYSGTLPSTRFGPEVSFGRAMADNTPDRKVAIIKVSRGSTSLATAWDPSDEVNGPKGYMYHGFESAVSQAIQELQDQGHSVEIRGVLWHQGSADSASTYEENLREFIQVVRHDLGHPHLPFLIGELAVGDPANNSNRLALRAIQANVAATTDFAGFIPADGLAVLNDLIHFSAPGVIELGQRYATTMQEIISNQPGDYNRDRIVGPSDYNVWRAHFGSTVDARADGNNDGAVNAADYVLWRDRLGSTAERVTVQFTFPDGSPFDAGTGTNPVPGYTQVETKEGLTLATVDARAPKYVVNPEDSNQFLWDGVTYVTRADSPPVRTNINGTNGLGIDNPTITSSQFGSESQNIHPDESWTFQFDREIVFKQIEFVSLDSGDKANIQVGDLISVDYTGGGNIKNNPFGSLVIPANTNITFTNTADSILTIDGTMSGLSIWRIKSLTVETPLLSMASGDGNIASVPEPSTCAAACIGAVGPVVVSWRRKICTRTPCRWGKNR